MLPPLASIDLGTNTARLLIGHLEPPADIRIVLIKRCITRLGGGFSRENGISPEAKARTIAALKDFAAEIATHGAATVRAVATSAVRDAVNGAALCRDIHEATGIMLEVIDGRAEGLLTLQGVLAGIDDRNRDLLIFDVGGGSTEYTLTRDSEAVFTDSLPLGVVRLTEGQGDIVSIENKVLKELTFLEKNLKEKGLLPLMDGVALIGTAGTATTLAAMSLRMQEYDYRLVNNYVVPLEEIKTIFEMLLPMRPEERLEVPGLERGREDLIIAGMVITIKTMEMFGFKQLKVSDFGLLEGLLLSIQRG